MVYDGPYITDDVSDINYTNDLTRLQSHWSGFSDPHTTVVEYFVAVGTTPGGTDVQYTITMGTATSKFLCNSIISFGLITGVNVCVSN